MLDLQEYIGILQTENKELKRLLKSAFQEYLKMNGLSDDMPDWWEQTLEQYGGEFERE